MKNTLFLIVIIFLSCDNQNPINLNPELGLLMAENEFHLDVENSIEVSAEISGATLYKGTLGESAIIWLYVNEQEHPCGGNQTIIDAMYSYDKQESWILLSVTTDPQKQNYCMVEDHFTGVLFLVANENSLNGTWISPNAERQLKVELHKTKLDNETKENLDETLFDDLLYNKNDC